MRGYTNDADMCKTTLMTNMGMHVITRTVTCNRRRAWRTSPTMYDAHDDIMFYVSAGSLWYWAWSFHLTGCYTGAGPELLLSLEVWL